MTELNMTRARDIHAALVEPLSLGELAGALNISTEAARPILRRMEAIGVVKKVARGTWVARSWDEWREVRVSG